MQPTVGQIRSAHDMQPLDGWSSVMCDVNAGKCTSLILGCFKRRKRPVLPMTELYAACTLIYRANSRKFEKKKEKAAWANLTAALSKVKKGGGGGGGNVILFLVDDRGYHRFNFILMINMKHPMSNWLQINFSQQNFLALLSTQATKQLRKHVTRLHHCFTLKLIVREDSKIF